MTFIEGSGFARWADTNRLVILFPQVEASILNPKACWDWWGYTGKDFLTKDAPQIAAIWRMVERLASGHKTGKRLRRKKPLRSRIFAKPLKFPQSSVTLISRERRRTSHVIPNDGGAADRGSA